MKRKASEESLFGAWKAKTRSGKCTFAFDRMPSGRCITGGTQLWCVADAVFRDRCGRFLMGALDKFHALLQRLKGGLGRL